MEYCCKALRTWWDRNKYELNKTVNRKALTLIGCAVLTFAIVKTNNQTNKQKCYFIDFALISGTFIANF